MIHGVRIEPLTKIADERGAIFHILRQSDIPREKIGEVYCSKIYPQVIKGWHRHKKMQLRYVVTFGMIKLVLYDDRKNSPTYGELQVIFLGDEHYSRVTIPPMVWNGFKGIGVQPALVINCASLAHDP